MVIWWANRDDAVDGLGGGRKDGLVVPAGRDRVALRAPLPEPVARTGCPHPETIIEAKERHAGANVEELRNRARWGQVG